MENVVAFNNELSGLYESKPPISKAKMAAITRAAMRAIKFYKHVVQSVEKFILKCKPEYKVPGLYVIDSIVRQSRHQYGPEKDVFAPRFARNMKDTFANLFRCAPEDKSRIIRVLNLWQKNNVFAPDVIQPIFDLADPNHPIYSMPPPVSTSSSAGPSSSANLSIPDMSASQPNGSLNTSSSSLDISAGGGSVPQQDDKLPTTGLADLSNNNLKQLLNDPNVLRQLQTLQNFTKFKQDEKQHNLRLQEEAFEKHLQNVLKNSAPSSAAIPEAVEFNKEVEFVSEEQKIEVINLDANDSRSPSPDRDRYNKRRRSRSRSRSRDRGARNRNRGRSRSRSRSRSPRSSRRRNSRERNERSNRDKERDREHERERRKKGLPDVKKDHLSVCSTTLWVGHLSKLVYQEELSDTFGEYGDIVSIDQIVPRGCAFIVMNRRQDAYKAMQGLKNHKLQGRVITISWAAGKGVKSKDWKDFWDLELGVTYIPLSKLDESADFDGLEEGGMFDEDSMPGWMKEKIKKLKSLKEKANEQLALAGGNGGISGPPPNLPPSGNPGMMFGIDTTQPPPGPPPTGGPPPILPMVPNQFSMAPPIGGPPRMLGPPPHMGMPMSGIHMPPNIVPPHPMMMMPGFGVTGPGGGPPIGPPHMPPMGGPHGAHPAQFPPPSGGSSTSAMPSDVPADDQMDIEMEEEEGTALASANTSAGSSSGNNMNFLQPPPSFLGGSASSIENSSPTTGEQFPRERNRSGGGSGSRWGSRGPGPDDDSNENRWHENGGPLPQGGMHNFPDGGPRNLGGPPHRPDFMNDFDNRGEPGNRGGGGGPNFNGGNNDFHPNMQNRFNQPTNLMQMRIPPPNAFNQRGGPGGGPPMFMRGGQGGPGGGGGGGRQQGPGFFNRNNPFDRDINDVFGGRGRGRGGGRGGGRGRGGRGGGFGGGRDGISGGGPHGGNWSDEEGEENIFKRRGGNRFRDREDSGDRFNMRDNNNRGGRRGGGGMSRDRNDNERDMRGGRGMPATGGNASGSGGIGSGRRMSRDDYKKKPHFNDTEEDWDRELEDYDTRSDNKAQTQTVKSGKNIDSGKTINDEAGTTEKPVLLSNDTNTETKDFKEDNNTNTNVIKSNFANTPTIDNSDRNTKSATPLYDELPPPKVNVVTNQPINETLVLPAVVNAPPFAVTEKLNKPQATETTATSTPAKAADPSLINASNTTQANIEASSDNKSENATDANVAANIAAEA